MTTDNKTLAVDVLAVMHSVLGDLMAAQVAGVDTDTTVPELSASIDAVAELIEVTRQFDSYASADFGDTSILDNEDLWDRLSAALARVKGASA